MVDAVESKKTQESDKILNAYTRTYPPRAATINAGQTLYLLEDIYGEGFFDAMHIVMTSRTGIRLYIEIDGYEWLNINPAEIHESYELGITGWMGLLACQIYDAVNHWYGMTIIPVKDTVPFYSTIRIWVTNTSSASHDIRRGITFYRRKTSSRMMGGIKI